MTSSNISWSIRYSRCVLKKQRSFRKEEIPPFCRPTPWYLTFHLQSKFGGLANISRVHGANFVAKSGPLDAGNEFLSS